MDSIEISGKTVEEALDKALQELGVSKEKVEYQIIEPGSKGIWGIFGKKFAKIKVVIKPNPLQKTVQFLEDITSVMDLPVKINTVDEGQVVKVDILGKDVGVLIGRRGETLDALQYLVNLVLNKNNEKRQKIFLDIEGYRYRRKHTLQRLALRLADKVRERGRRVALEPMNSQERRIIHTALQVRNDIYTVSEGEEPYRKIIINPKR
ncbi:MAG: protein jag [Desulfotomaculum sp.]|nr:protein jag [Desulfotomaculum sp.]